MVAEKRNPQVDRSPNYGVPKERIPEDWIRAREVMQHHPWAIFHVRKWYFPALVAVALALFAAGILLPSFEFSVAAGILTFILYYVNRRAREARAPGK